MFRRNNAPFHYVCFDVGAPLYLSWLHGNKVNEIECSFKIEVVQRPITWDWTVQVGVTSISNCLDLPSWRQYLLHGREPRDRHWRTASMTGIATIRPDLQTRLKVKGGRTWPRWNIVPHKGWGKSAISGTWVKHWIHAMTIVFRTNYLIAVFVTQASASALSIVEFVWSDRGRNRLRHCQRVSRLTGTSKSNQKHGSLWSPLRPEVECLPILGVWSLITSTVSFPRVYIPLSESLEQRSISSISFLSLMRHVPITFMHQSIPVLAQGQL